MAIGTVALLFGVVAASTALSPNTPSTPHFPTTATTSPADCADRYAAIIEHFQPANARDPGGPNAWAMLIDAAAAMREVDARVWRGPAADSTDALPDFALIYAPPADITERDSLNLALSLKLLDEYRAAGVSDKLAIIPSTARAVRARPGSQEYDRAVRAMGAAQADDSWDGKIFGVLLSELAPTRALARINAARMHRAAEARDTQTFLSAFEQTLAIARVCSHQPGAIDRLVACSVARLAADQAGKAVRAGWTDAAVIDGLAAALERQTKWPSLRLTIEGERLLALDTCRWLFDGDGKLDPKAAAIWGAIAGGDHPFDHTKIGDGRETRDDAVKTFNLAFDILAESPDPSSSQLKRLASDVAAFKAALPPGHALVRLMLPTQLKTYEENSRSRARLAVLRITLALEKHKAATGSYPDTLDQLVRTVDVIDPWTDLSLRYTKTAASYEISSAEADAP